MLFALHTFFFTACQKNWKFQRVTWRHSPRSTSKRRSERLKVVSHGLRKFTPTMHGKWSIGPTFPLVLIIFLLESIAQQHQLSRLAAWTINPRMSSIAAARSFTFTPTKPQRTSQQKRRGKRVGGEEQDMLLRYGTTESGSFAADSSARSSSIAANPGRKAVASDLSSGRLGAEGIALAPFSEDIVGPNRCIHSALSCKLGNGCKNNPGAETLVCLVSTEDCITKRPVCNGDGDPEFSRICM